jgi:hypothetical protein
MANDKPVLIHHRNVERIGNIYVVHSNEVKDTDYVGKRK